MAFKLEDVIINLENEDVEDICSCWQWRLQEQSDLMLVSKLGDMFLRGTDGCVYWLQTGTGDFDKVADSIEHFEYLVGLEDVFDNWFLPELIAQLQEAGKLLESGQVYSYKKPPVLGGDYGVENFDITNVSVHFAIAGQICEQIQNLPDGTQVNIVLKK